LNLKYISKVKFKDNEKSGFGDTLTQNIELKITFDYNFWSLYRNKFTFIYYNLVHTYFTKIITTKNRFQIYLQFKQIGHKYIKISWNWNLMHNSENQSCIWSFKWKH
jgi:hypothetical protein